MQPVDRNGIFDHLPHDLIIRNYRNLFKTEDNIGITEIKRHADLEGELTDRLLSTTICDRFDVFSDAYNRLYRELPWLVGTGTTSGAQMWLSLLRRNSRVYEIGSGAGYLINYLAAQGYSCVASELAKDRQALAGKTKKENIVWSLTDGVNISKYVDSNYFDYVISDQVIEHMHPDDLLTQLMEARKILKEGGEYIVRTPYGPLGPADLSKVFGLDRAIFMHLHEYKLSELVKLCNDAGFHDVYAIFMVPKTKVSLKTQAYLKYLLGFEQFFFKKHNSVSHKIGRKLHRFLFIRRNIFIGAKK